MTSTWDIRNVIERFCWTFIQASVGSISVVAATTAVTGGNVGALRTIGLTALGAGVAALLSLAKNLTAEGIVVQSSQRAAAVVVAAAAPLRPQTYATGGIVSATAPYAWDVTPAPGAVTWTPPTPTPTPTPEMVLPPLPPEKAKSVRKAAKVRVPAATTAGKTSAWPGGA